MATRRASEQSQGGRWSIGGTARGQALTCGRAAGSGTGRRRRIPVCSGVWSVVRASPPRLSARDGVAARAMEGWHARSSRARWPRVVDGTLALPASIRARCVPESFEAGRPRPLLSMAVAVRSSSGGSWLSTQASHQPGDCCTRDDPGTRAEGIDRWGESLERRAKTRGHTGGRSGGSLPFPSVSSCATAAWCQLLRPARSWYGARLSSMEHDY